MTLTTIENTISSEVDLGSGGIATGILIYPNAEIRLIGQPNIAEIRAVYLPSSAGLGAVYNLGTISAITSSPSPGGEAIVMAAPGKILNNGLIDGNLFGVVAENGGIIQNDGRIISQTQGVAARSSTLIDNYGTISGTEVGVSLQGSTLINTGCVSASNYGVYLSDNSNLKNTGTIVGSIAVDLPSGGTVINSGKISGTIAVAASNSLLLAVQSGAQFYGLVVDTDNAGTLELMGTKSGYLEVDNFSGFSQINFLPNAIWTLEGTPLQLSEGETITGFARKDKIVIDDFIATSETAISATQFILEDKSESITLNLAGEFSTSRLLVEPNLYGGTDITAPCFLSGTLITTSSGKRRVEDLKIGDEVLTLSGSFVAIEWIGKRSYEGGKIVNSEGVQPICIKKGAIDSGIPSRDLFVSPDHSLYFDGRLVRAFLLVNNVSIVRVENLEAISYYHVELGKHDVIYAEDCPAESYLDANCRDRFENVRKNFGLCNAVENEGLPCFPRVEDGFSLYRIKNIINYRQKIPCTSNTCGAIRGCLDEAGPELVRGWIQNTSSPEVPIMLEILVNGRVEAIVIANGFRSDLKKAGLGSGCHAFEHRLTHHNNQTIVVRQLGETSPAPLNGLQMR